MQQRYLYLWHIAHNYVIWVVYRFPILSDSGFPCFHHYHRHHHHFVLLPINGVKHSPNTVPLYANCTYCEIVIDFFNWNGIMIWCRQVGRGCEWKPMPRISLCDPGVININKFLKASQDNWTPREIITSDTRDEKRTFNSIWVIELIDSWCFRCVPNWIQWWRKAFTRSQNS